MKHSSKISARQQIVFFYKQLSVRTQTGICESAFKATFHLTISMRGQRATGKINGIITITGAAGPL